MDESLGALLRRLRTEQGFSLRVVETKTGISNAYLSQVETGKAENPSPHLLKKLADLYKGSYDTLMRIAGYAPAGSTQRDVFLSHRAHDKDVVRELAADLESEEAHGHPLTAWLDEAEIRPGQSIPGMVNDGLEKSRFIAIVMSPDYFQSDSGWTDAEWHAALHNDPDNRQGRLIPLLVADCPYVPYLLRHLRCIDLRGTRYTQGLQELLSLLRDEPLPRPVTHRGQLITGSGRLSRATLVAERAVPEADPDPVTERLWCNLLPIERLPRYVYSAAIAQDLIKIKPNGKPSLPSKQRLKEIIREEQGRATGSHYMPAFRVFEDRIFTFHDLENPDGALAPIIDENDTEVLDVNSFVRDPNLRSLLTSLLNMSIVRHASRGELTVDDMKQGRRVFFPAKDGGPNVITWTPRKKKATRVVAKPVLKDGNVVFWRHLGAYLQTMFLGNRFYLQISPTWVLTSDGEHALGGPDIGRRVMRWTGPERNLQVLFHIRFWTSVLRQGRGGPISIRTGDQSMEVATIPASIQQVWGIANDQQDLLRLLDEEAPIIAAEEDERVDSILEEELPQDELDDEFAVETEQEGASDDADERIR